MRCDLCPRNCRIDREKNKGFCRMGGLPVVAKAFLHKWEEPCISGNRGSGTVFFSGCNLRCLFCQNYMISQECFGREIPVEALGKIFLSLQNKGAHNINLVNPTHFIEQIREAVMNEPRLEIPVIYNSNGYDSVPGLRRMEEIIDVYLPDFKYFDNDTAKRFSGADGYFETVTAAILEMYRQVGGVVFDDEGMLKRGLVIRHLILPGLSGESIRILDWIKENLPLDIVVSVMSQYLPYYKAAEHSEIGRRITRREYERVVNHFFKLDFENGYIQERTSAEEDYIPVFDLEGVEEV